jgi:hypothetical protein
MKPANSRISLRLVYLSALTGALLVPSFPLAAQNPAPPKPPARAKKVWTEDDLIALRTPSDVYRLEQARKTEEDRAVREAEEAARKDAAAHPPQAGQQAAAPPAEAAPQIPTNPAEIRRRIEVVRKQVDDLQFEVQKGQDDLNAAREDQKSEVVARNAAVNEKYAKAQAELQALEDKLREVSPPPGS